MWCILGVDMNRPNDESVQSTTDRPLLDILRDCYVIIHDTEIPGGRMMPSHHVGDFGGIKFSRVVTNSV